MLDSDNSEEKYSRIKEKIKSNATSVLIRKALSDEVTFGQKIK